MARANSWIGSLLAVGILLSLGAPALAGSVDGPFLRGDTNASGAVDIADAIATLEWLFIGGVAADCPDAADTNDDGVVDLADAVVTLGCAIEHASAIGYAEPFQPGGARMTPIGINCRICPRVHCEQRAHQAVVATQPVDERRRGATRFES